MGLLIAEGVHSGFFCNYHLCVYYTLLYPKQGNIVIVRLSPPIVKCNSMPDQTNSPVVSVLQNYFLDQLSKVKKRRIEFIPRIKLNTKGKLWCEG